MDASALVPAARGDVGQRTLREGWRSGRGRRVDLARAWMVG
ncbi:hypothetical protein Acaty_c2154 [Acidithiobacillus caldus ATCC 51756]|uniref:Uncharacterized protein n=1 Tax=Acidithiobacillus caldus (strain ATCC 51756 / DSM 8584 / KU) TaxID=637389 RepID=A0A059ZX12_ACICK|nr:hypothetical protein Acaty_c2154 [Acidithiobacillus caldus ATCC 51756]